MLAFALRVVLGLGDGSSGGEVKDLVLAASPMSRIFL